MDSRSLAEPILNDWARIWSFLARATSRLKCSGGSAHLRFQRVAARGIRCHDT
jgi:hypothetical protein